MQLITRLRLFKALNFIYVSNAQLFVKGFEQCKSSYATRIIAADVEVENNRTKKNEYN